MTSLTLCDGEGDKSFAALAVVRSQIAYGPIMDPYPISFVGGGVAYIAGRDVSNVREAPVGLLMPVSGFLEVDAFCIVLTLPNAVIQGTVVGGEVNVRVKVTASLAYGSGFKA